MGDANNESSKFTTRKWYVANDQNSTDYGEGNWVQPSNLKQKSLNQIFAIIQDAYILVTANIKATGGDADTRVAFKDYAPFTKCITHINNEHVDNADNLDIIMSMYNLIKYSDNYSDTSRHLSQFKRDESPVTAAGNPAILLQLIHHLLNTDQVFLNP